MESPYPTAHVAVAVKLQIRCIKVITSRTGAWSRAFTNFLGDVGRVKSLEIALMCEAVGRLGVTTFRLDCPCLLILYFASLTSRPAVVVGWVEFLRCLHHSKEH